MLSHLLHLPDREPHHYLPHDCMADMDTVLLCAGASSKDASDCAVERSRQDGEVAGNEVGFLQQCEMNAIRVFRHLECR